MAARQFPLPALLVVSLLTALLQVLPPDQPAPPVTFAWVKRAGNLSLQCREAEPGGAGGPGRLRVDRLDSGLYSCLVTGRGGVAGRGRAGPRVLAAAGASQTPGWPASLSCTVAGLPVPAVSWVGPAGAAVVSGAGVAISLSSFRDGQLTSCLTLDAVTQQQFGNYTCTAANSLGQVRR